jgi:hypothetical protein
MWVGSCALQKFIEGQKSASKERTEQRMTARKLPRSGLVQLSVIDIASGATCLFSWARLCHIMGMGLVIDMVCLRDELYWSSGGFGTENVALSIKDEDVLMAGSVDGFQGWQGVRRAPRATRARSPAARKALLSRKNMVEFRLTSAALERAGNSAFAGPRSPAPRARGGASGRGRVPLKSCSWNIMRM